MGGWWWEGSLNFILAFSFVFLVMVLAMGFYCDLCFQKNNSFCELWGIFWFYKVWGSSIFFLSFWGSSFSFFYVKGGAAFLLWILSIFCFIILNFRSLQFFLSFCGFRKKNCVKFHKGGEGVICFLLVNFKSFLFSYFEVPKFSIFFLSFWGSLKKKLVWGDVALLLWILRVFCFTILKFQSFQFFFFVGLQKYLCEVS